MKNETNVTNELDEDDYLDEFLAEGKITEADKQETLRVRKIFDRFLAETKDQVKEKMTDMTGYVMEAVIKEVDNWSSSGIKSMLDADDVVKQLESISESIDAYKGIKDRYDEYLKQMVDIQIETKLLLERSEGWYSLTKKLESDIKDDLASFKEDFDKKISEMKSVSEEIQYRISELEKDQIFYRTEVIPTITAANQYMGERLDYMEFDLRRKSKLIEQLMITQVFLMIPMAVNVGFGIYEYFFKKGKKNEGNQPS